MFNKHLLLTACLVLSVAGFLGCIRKGESPISLEVNLSSGVQEMAKIGDSEGQVIERAKRWKPDVTELPRQVNDEPVSWGKVHHYKELGMKIYFRYGRVALIELQEPFRGSIQGKKLQIFSFGATAGISWEETLIKEFGSPQVRASGGRFGAEAFFYQWGDVSFNRMGPNELAIYRDRDISILRQKSFGRDVRFFQP